MEKTLFTLLLLTISFNSFSQIVKGMDGLILTNEETALSNDVKLKKVLFEKIIPIIKVDSMIYETQPISYKNPNYQYKFRFVVRDNKIITSIYFKVLDIFGDDFTKIKATGGESNPSFKVYKNVYDILHEVGGDIQ